jgi:Ca2+-binding RTX toxin-like protein
MTPARARGTLILPNTNGPRVTEDHMSKIRLIAAVAGAVLMLAFATSALAAGGGSPGADDFAGSARADHVSLQAGDDRANGGRGNDDINGGRGDDRINGGAGDDRLRGGSGDDALTDNRGTDRFSGGAGDDRINARDRRGRDVVDCGAGDDTALVDDDDIVRHCEHVERAGDDNGVDAPGTEDKGGLRAPGVSDDAPGHR